VRHFAGDMISGEMIAGETFCSCDDYMLRLRFLVTGSRELCAVIAGPYDGG
jgi:hypothetical protein